MPYLLEIEIVLRRFTPKVWRRFLLRADANFSDLHDAIQEACGWKDYHLHGFFEPGPARVDWDRRIARSPYDDDDPEVVAQCPTSDEVMLSDHLARSGDGCVYLYDYGDSWEVDVTVLDRRFLPERCRRRLLDGERAFPLEDCGGISGYEEIVANFGRPRAKLDEYLRERLDWVHEMDPKWRPDKFNLAAAKKRFDRTD